MDPRPRPLTGEDIPRSNARRYPAKEQANFDRRLSTHPADNCFPKGSNIKGTGQTGPKPGSRNPRKVGR